MNKKYPIIIAAVVVAIGIGLSISSTIPTQMTDTVESGGGIDQSLPITATSTHGRNLTVDLSESMGVHSNP